MLKTIYTAKEEEYKSGIYYRVIVAYKVRHSKEGFMGLGYTDKECAEVYEFFMVREKANDIKVNEIIDGTALTTGKTAQNGFTVGRNGSVNTITVKLPNGTTTKNISDRASFTEKGEYVITSKTPLGTTATTKIIVAKGLDLYDVPGRTYESENSTGYQVNDASYKATASYGSSTYGNLYVAVIEGAEVSRLSSVGTEIFGVTGQGV